MLRSISVVWFCLIVLVGCGSPYKEKDIKNFVLTTNADTPENIKQLFAQLVSEFNAQAGFKALTFSRDGGNSPVNLVDGLERRGNENHIGEGQSIIEIQEEFPLNGYIGVGERPERRNYYTMHIDLDKDYVVDHAAKADQESHYELQKLFFHEVGHGLTFDHDPVHPKDLMYPLTNGEKDFVGFFRRVRGFFGINS